MIKQISTQTTILDKDAFEKIIKSKMPTIGEIISVNSTSDGNIAITHKTKRYMLIRAENNEKLRIDSSIHETSASAVKRMNDEYEQCRKMRKYDKHKSRITDNDATITYLSGASIAWSIQTI